MAVAACFAWLLAFWVDHPVASGDAPWLLDGTDALRHCLERADFVACQFDPHAEPTAFGGLSPIGPWPALQYLPDLVSTRVGVEAHPDRVRILALLGLAALATAVLLARVALRRAGLGAWFWAFLAVLLSGPMIAYANTSWGEPLASGLLVCLVAATTLQARPVLVALAVFGACLTKETAYPFVVAIGILGLVLARRRTGRPIRPHVAWGAVGLVLGIGLASLFNVVRYGSLLNTNQLRPEFRTPGIARKLEAALGLIISPNGGILFFWASATVLLATACLWPLLRARRHVDRRPALVLIAVVVMLTAGLASWWTPFGWQAWGPRLTLPWVLPIVLLAVVCYGDALAALARDLLTPRWRFALIGVTLVFVTLPHVGYLSRPEATLARFFSDMPHECVGRSEDRVASPRYYACLRQEMWRRRPMLLDALPALKTKAGIVTSAAVALGLLGSLGLLREGLRLNTASGKAPDTEFV